MPRFRPATKEPCNACPFRTQALAGWLGAGSPESFIECIQREEPLPCHKTIDYTDPHWKEKWLDGKTGKTCAGSLILMANMCKLPRDPTFPQMPPSTRNVFATPRAFISYHRAASTQSWRDDGEED